MSIQSVLKRSYSRNLARKMAAYSSFAAGAGVGLLGSGQADAAVVPYSPPGAPIQLFGSLNHHMNLDGDSDSDIAIFATGSGLLLGDYFGQFGDLGSNRVMSVGGLAAIVAPGGLVGPDTSDWLNNAPMSNFSGTRGYAGVVFDIPGGSPHFGYLDIGVDSSGRPVTIYGGAYESEPNTPIQVPVPEPGALALLAIGAAGLTSWRRRKNDGASVTAR